MAKEVKKTETATPAASSSSEVKSETKSSSSKPWIFGFGGIVVAIVVCLCACCLVFMVMAATSEDFNESFKEEYCTSYLEDGGRLSEEPLGLCEDYYETNILNY